MTSTTCEYVRVVKEEESPPPLPLEPALKTSYEPDRFQKFAIEAIERGENVLVTERTGSGKTFVGEYQIAKSLQRGGRVFYTTPIKSLSNQKFHDLTKLFPEASVGILTGDIKFRPDAQILVMTTEILRNMLFKKGTATEQVGLTSLVSLENLDAVVFDEVHYINDPDRGHVWEETLMLLPREVKLILLSATLSQPYGFAKWLGECKKVPVWLISTLWRAVPLYHCVRTNQGELSVIYDPKEQFHADVYSAWLRERNDTLLAHDKYQQKVKDARRNGVEGPISGKVRPKTFEHEMNDLLEELDRKKNLPAIFFVFSRAGCEKLAKKVTGDYLDSSDSAAVAHIWDFHLSRYKESLEKSPQAHELRELAMRGIAYHHSGLLPFMKEILEILFSKGLVKVLFATETFAVGINMPTKTVIFTALEKFSDGGMRPLRSAEYIQMAGRAGRRGKDDRGLVIYLPQKEPADVSQVRTMMTGKASTFESRMSFHYDFVLKMLLSGVNSRELIEGSYWWSLLQEEAGRIQQDYQKAREVEETAFSALTGAQQLGCEEYLAIESRVKTSQNAKKKLALRELAAWEDAHSEKWWMGVLEKYRKAKVLTYESQALKNAYASVSEQLADVEKALPQITRRLRALQEFGFVSGGDVSRLTTRGQLASEVNEGHPYLMVELFERLRVSKALKTETLSLEDLLTILALFLGEAEEGTKTPDQLSVSTCVREELRKIQEDAEYGASVEARLGLPDDPEFWKLRTEWVEPIQEWIQNPQCILPELAMKFEVFEGTIQKALMKLMGLVEEFRAMCELAGEVEWLKILEGAQERILRGVVVAESLYLRL